MLLLVAALGLFATALTAIAVFSLMYMSRYPSGLVPGLLVALGAGWWALYTVRTLVAHVRGPWTESVAQMLERQRGKIVLVLRPFGADASVRVRTTKWRLSPYIALEDIIGRAAHASLGVPTYSLVDSCAGVRALGPRYVLSSDASWKKSVESLLEITTAVVILIPPKGRLTESLRWELSRLLPKVSEIFRLDDTR